MKPSWLNILSELVEESSFRTKLNLKKDNFTKVQIQLLINDSYISLSNSLYEPTDYTHFHSHLHTHIHTHAHAHTHTQTAIFAGEMILTQFTEILAILLCRKVPYFHSLILEFLVAADLGLEIIMAHIQMI